jgi:hypothetical protein
MQRQNVFFVVSCNRLSFRMVKQFEMIKIFLRKRDFWKCGATLISELLRKDAQTQNQPEHIPRVTR